MRTLVPVLLKKLLPPLAAAPTAKPSVLMSGIMFALVHFTYLALVVILIIAGTGVPIPEDIPLILSGYMCNVEHSPINSFPRMVDLDGDGVLEAVPRRVPHLYWMMLAGMVGVLTGDSMVFSIGRRGIDANNFVARHLRKVMHSKRREKVERHFAKHGNLTIFVGRFMPGFRSIIFAFAGISRMSYWRFLLIDGLAALLSVPLFVFIGYHFAGELNMVFAKIEQIKHILGPILVVVGIGAAALYFVRRRRKLAAGPIAKDVAPGV
jgi:membrane protein DedA with SNARE-associated domain